MSESEALTSKLSAARVKYRKSVEEVRENARKKIEDIKKSAQNTQNNQKAAYNKDRMRIENEARDTLDKHIKKSTDRMEEATDKYRENIGEMQKKHDRERFLESQAINEKLNRISDQYRIRQDLNKARSNELLNQVKKSVDDRQKQDILRIAKERDEFNETSRDQMRDFLNKQSLEMKDLSDRHQKEMLEVNEYNLKDKNRVKNSLNAYIDELKASNKTEKDLLIKDKKEATERYKQARMLDRARLEKEFATSFERLSSKTHNDQARKEKELLRQLNFERKLFEDDSRKKSNIVNDMVETTRTNKLIHEGQMRNAKARMDLIRQQTIDSVHKNQKEARSRYEMLDRKHLAARRSEKERILNDSRQKYNDLLNNKIEAVNKEKSDSRIMVHRYQQQLRGLLRDSDLRIFENNRDTKKLLSENNEHHIKMVNRMTARNKEALD